MAEDIEFDFTGDFRQLLSGIVGFNSELKNTATQTDNVNKKLAETARKSQQVTDTVVNGAKAATEAAVKRNGAYQKELGIINSQVQRLASLQQARDRSNNTSAIERFNKKIDETSAQLAALTGKQNQYTAATTQAAKATKQQSSAFETLRNAAAAYLGLNFLQTQGAEVVGVTAKFQGYERALKVIFGSQAEAAAQTDFISATVKRFGLELESTTQAYVKFAGASQLSGLNAQETQSIFTNVSSAVSALGLSADDANGVFLALGQIISKGTVQAEELRGQIGERLPGAFAIAADAVGVTQQELNKLLQNGEVLSKDFLPKFSDELGKRFSGAADEAAKSTTNLNRDLNSARNAITEFRLELGSANTGLISGLFSLVSIENIRIFVKLITTLVSAFAAYKTVLFVTTAAQKAYTLAQQATAVASFVLKNGVTGLRFAMTALNGTMNIFAGIAAIAAGALVFFSSSSDEATAADDSFEKQLEDTNKQLDARIDKLDKIAAAGNKATKAQLESAITDAQSVLSDLQDQLTQGVGAAISAGVIDKNFNIKQATIDAVTKYNAELNDINQLTKSINSEPSPFDAIFEVATGGKSLAQLSTQIETQKIRIENFSNTLNGVASNQVNYAKLSNAELNKLALQGDKAAKDELKRREDAIKKYQDLLKQLVDARKQATLDLAADDEERARLEKKYRDEDINNLENSIKAYKALSVDQIAMFNDLRLASEKKLTEDLLKIYRERDRLTASLTLDNDKRAREEFELDLRDKNDKLRAAGIDELSIRKFNDQQLEAFNRDAALKRLDVEEDTANRINETIDRTGMSEVQVREDIEKNKLALTIEYAKKRLAILEADPNADITQINSLKVAIGNAQSELQTLENKPKNLNIFELFGFDLSEDKQAAILTGFKEFYGSLTSIASDSLKTQIDINNSLLSNLDSSISQTQQSIANALELNKQGFANNLDELQLTLDQQQEARKKALEEQRKLQRQQILLDSITQAGSLVTASANIFKALSPLGPAGVVASVAVIGAMFAAFLASKAQAAQATQQGAFLEEGGILPGPSHKQGGVKLIDSRTGEELGEAEGGEFLNSKKATGKFKSVLEALNNNRPGKALELLREKMAGKSFSIERVVKETRDAQAGVSVNVDNTGTERGIERVEARLSETNRLLKNQTTAYSDGDKTVITKGNKTRIIRKK
jgi:tape measure domain-containing protein